MTSAKCLSVGVLFSIIVMAARPLGVESVTYEVVPQWAQLPQGMEWGEVGNVEVGRDGKVYVLRRTDPPVVVLESSGRFIKSLGSNLFVWPHGLMVDRSGQIWVSDAGPRPDWKPDPAGRGQQVMRLTHDGQVLLTLGTKGVAGEGPNTFSGAADLVEAPNGDVFIADGHVNNRVVKIARDGRLLKTWGTKGSKPGEFNQPHAIAMDSRGRVFVGDRGNGRIQIFDQEGEFLAGWTQFGAPSGIAIGPNDTMAVTDLSKKVIHVGSARDGSVTLSFPANGEMLALDAKGDIYLGEIAGKTLTKFARRNHKPSDR